MSNSDLKHCECKNPKDLIQLIRSDGVEVIELSWPDDMGLWYSTTIKSHEVSLQNLVEGIRFSNQVLLVDSTSARFDTSKKSKTILIKCSSIDKPIHPVNSKQSNKESTINNSNTNQISNNNNNSSIQLLNNNNVLNINNDKLKKKRGGVNNNNNTSTNVKKRTTKRKQQQTSIVPSSSSESESDDNRNTTFSNNNNMFFYFNQRKQNSNNSNSNNNNDDISSNNSPIQENHNSDTEVNQSLTIPALTLSKLSYLIDETDRQLNDNSQQSGTVPSAGPSSPQLLNRGGHDYEPSSPSSSSSSPEYSPRSPISSSPSTPLLTSSSQSVLGKRKEEWLECPKNRVELVPDLSNPMSLVLEKHSNQQLNDTSNIGSVPNSDLSIDQTERLIIEGQIQLPPLLRPRQYHACKISKEDRSSKRRKNHTSLFCRHCGTNDTPEWRRGPDGRKSLCNACGLHYSKLVKRENQSPTTRKSFDIIDLLNPDV